MNSLRVKLSVLLVTFISGTFIIYFMINTTFLDTYYYNQKKSSLEFLYNSVNSIFGEEADGEISDSNRSYIIQICENAGITMYIDTASNENKFEYGSPLILEKRLQKMIFMGLDSNAEIIEKSDKYIFQKVLDPDTSSYYLEMWGQLDNGNSFIMRMAYEGIQESADISNRFFGYVGAIVILVSSIFMLFISKNFTKPILNISMIAQRMSNMDFDIKYTGNRSDEIGLLGNSINLLSKNLEKNITDLKKANIKLEKDLAKRTEMDEMRKEFLSNVSHELKSPIALIQGYAEGLIESINDDKESHDFYCHVIMDEANKMNNIVKKLLTLNQIEFGNQLNMERFDIISVISGVLTSSSILLKQKDITVYFDDRQPVYVWSDEFQTEEIIMNYISNAINHVDENKVIKINVKRVDNDIQVSVYNTGNHIPLEDLDKVWQKFYKVDKARTREYGGSGIGLSIVKAIQDSVNKQYGVNNVEGGVEFWFTIDAKN